MNKSDQNRALAFLLCSLLFVMYIQSVCVPYFFGQPTALKVADKIDNKKVGNSSTNSLSVAANSQEDKQAKFPSPTLSAPDSTSNNQLLTQQKTHIPLKTKDYPEEEDLDQAGYVVVKNEKFEITFSLLGGRITKFLLNEHDDALGDHGKKLNMINHENGPYPGGIVVGKGNDLWVHYVGTLSSDNQIFTGKRLEIQGKSTAQLSLVGVMPNGRQVKKQFYFTGNAYLFETKVIAPSEIPVAFEWSSALKKKTKSGGFQMGARDNGDALVWYDGERVHYEAYSSLEDADSELKDLKWVSLGDKYFMSSMISKSSTSGNILLSDKGDLVTTQIEGNNANNNTFLVYVGPKTYAELEHLGFDLQKNVNFGKTGFVAAPLLWLMHKFHSLFGNYGVAIVLLTILVKAVLYPLNSVSFKNMKAMQDLQPEIQRLRDQYQKDPQQQQQQIMSLYKRKNVNPLGGCFPMLLQLPIFIGLFSALRLSVELRHAHFAFWIKDLSAPESLEVFGFGVPVMVVLFVTSMVIQQWTMPSSMDPTQKRIMMIVPIMFGFMFASFPAGLTLYFLVNNLISIGQQRALQVGGDKAALKVTAIVSVSLFLLSLLLSIVG